MKIIAKTFSGLEEVLEKELIALGIENTSVSTRSVTFEADKDVLYKVNYFSRLAISFLVQIDEFKIYDIDDLYEKTMEIDWSQYMVKGTSYSLTTVCNSDLFEHFKYAAQIFEDAIADHYRENKDLRPTINKYNPDLQIELLIMDSSCFVSLNSSGKPLFQRGYREGDHPSPINEVLAAGLLQLSGWTPEIPLLDPMCGTGTIVIEAAMSAYKIPAAILREEFGFQKWIDYDEELWNKTKRFTKDLALETDIWGCDIARKNIDSTRQSLQNLGIGSKVKLVARDFITSTPIAKDGFIITNPPYAERLKTGNMNAFYTSLGKHIRKNYGTWTVWMITPDKDHVNHLKFTDTKTTKLVSGDFDSLFIKYYVDTDVYTPEELPEQKQAPVRTMRPRKPKI